MLSNSPRTKPREIKHVVLYREIEFKKILILKKLQSLNNNKIIVLYGFRKAMQNLY